MDTCPAYGQVPEAQQEKQSAKADSPPTFAQGWLQHMPAIPHRPSAAPHEGSHAASKFGALTTHAPPMQTLHGPGFPQICTLRHGVPSGTPAQGQRFVTTPPTSVVTAGFTHLFSTSFCGEPPSGH